jgi:hypothetical protein
MTKQPPRVLTTDDDRQMARQMRDKQWAFADRVAQHGTVWCCWWNKSGRHDTSKPLADDLMVCSLLTGMELLEWLQSHPDWWVIGEWSDDRYAAPVTITDAGRAALAERDIYDMEPVYGGLVEPGWQCIPAPAGDAP